MKPINGILGCALAAGLMTFAAGKAQAGIVIDDTLYTPLSFKIVATYNDPKTGKLKQASLTTKTFAQTFGLAKGDQLAAEIGDGGIGDVVIINNGEIVEDLTVDGYVSLDNSELVDNPTENKNSEKYSSSGLLTLNAYSDPVFDPEFDQSASEDSSDFWLEVSGLYSYQETFARPDKNGFSKTTTKLTAGPLTGEGFDIDLDDSDNLPVSATVTGNGSGKVQVP